MPDRPARARCSRRARAPPRTGGRPLVIEELASWAAAGDLPGLFARVPRLLFDMHVRLFARYGIALEAHQQNTALVLSQLGGAAGAEAPPGCS